MSLSCRKKIGRKRTGDSHLFCTFCAATNCEKLSGLFFASGKMSIIGRILSHYVQVLLLCTCNLSVAVWGVLKSGQYLVHHWGGTPCPLSAQRMNTSRLNHLLELPRPPNVLSIEAYRVHFARGAWRSQLLLCGERSVPMRVALSARVSTHDQHTRAMQIDAMRTFATRRGWTVTDAIEAWALMPQRTAPSARSCAKRLGNASLRSCWCGSSTVGLS